MVVCLAYLLVVQVVWVAYQLHQGASLSLRGHLGGVAVAVFLADERPVALGLKPLVQSAEAPRVFGQCVWQADASVRDGIRHPLPEVAPLYLAGSQPSGHRVAVPQRRAQAPEYRGIVAEHALLVGGKVPAVGQCEVAVIGYCPQVYCYLFHNVRLFLFAYQVRESPYHLLLVALGQRVNEEHCLLASASSCNTADTATSHATLQGVWLDNHRKVSVTDTLHLICLKGS